MLLALHDTFVILCDAVLYCNIEVQRSDGKAECSAFCVSVMWWYLLAWPTNSCQKPSRTIISTGGNSIFISLLLMPVSLALCTRIMKAYNFNLDYIHSIHNLEQLAYSFMLETEIQFITSYWCVNCYWQSEYVWFCYFYSNLNYCMQCFSTWTSSAYCILLTLFIV